MRDGCFTLTVFLLSHDALCVPFRFHTMPRAGLWSVKVAFWITLAWFSSLVLWKNNTFNTIIWMEFSIIPELKILRLPFRRSFYAWLTHAESAIYTLKC